METDEVMVGEPTDLELTLISMDARLERIEKFIDMVEQLVEEMSNNPMMGMLMRKVGG